MHVYCYRDLSRTPDIADHQLEFCKVAGLPTAKAAVTTYMTSCSVCCHFRHSLLIITYPFPCHRRYGSLMEFRVFEVVPTSGSIGIKELAAKCEVEETLNRRVPYNGLKGTPETLLTFPVRLMTRPTCAGIFNEVKLLE